MNTPTSSTTPATRPGIAIGGNGWDKGLLPLVQLAHSMGFSSTSLAFYWYPGVGATPKLPSVPKLHAQAALWALENGMSVNIVVQVANGNQDKPWSDPEGYLSGLKSLCVACAAIIPPALRSRISVTVNNENLPVSLPDGPVGDNPWTWTALWQFYQGPLTQAVGLVHNIVGCEAWIGAPGDSGTSYLEQAMEATGASPAEANFPAQVVRDTGASRLVVHYVTDTALLDKAHAFYGLPLVMGEFGWELNSPAEVAAQTAYCGAHGYPCYYWEAYEPGGTQLLGNEPMLKALGVAAPVTVGAGPSGATAGGGTASAAGATNAVP